MDRLQRFRLPIMIGLVAVVGVVIFSVLRPSPPQAAISVTLRPTQADPAATTGTPATIQVYVSGAVKHPDVYTLPARCIVKDAMLAAGGPAEDADLDRINLAAPLSDGMQIHFPRKGEAAPAPGGSGPGGAPASGPVNINTATLDQLDTLPGIGPSIGQSIIDYRTANGPFKTIEQIKDVKGIGDALFEKIKNSITVGP